jgi:murein L,D-transpeptidase YafK
VLPACVRIVRIEVWKRAHTLRAYCSGGAMVTMHVALGREEVGPKTRSDDHRTPEGTYRIAEEARAGRFHLFIPIDYPSRSDAERALARGRLPRPDYERIVEAHERGLPPPQDTALGGNLGFHGEGDRWRGDSRHLDWTYGCIAVTDAEIEFLAERIEPGVPVWIQP